MLFSMGDKPKRGAYALSFSTLNFNKACGDIP